METYGYCTDSRVERMRTQDTEKNRSPVWIRIGYLSKASHTCHTAVIIIYVAKA
jgi:hypothetical protein